jgi:C-terminal processing protease CtpA/Prc
MSSIDYDGYINDILNIVRTKGVAKYVKQFNKTIKDVDKDIHTESTFMKYANQLLGMYHPHSSLYKTNASTEHPKKKNKDTLFSFSPDKIGKIQLFSFTTYNGPKQYELEKKKFIDDIHDFLDESERKGMKGLIIDFSKNGGGGMWQIIDAFNRYLNNTTLFAWSTEKVNVDKKEWVNLESNKIVWNKKYLTKDLKTDIPIAVIVSKHTASAGEIGASLFKSSNNVKVFGEKTKGYLSVNYTIPIGKEFGVIFTSTLQTSKDGTFNEFIVPDVITHTPITCAKKWITTTV